MYPSSRIYPSRGPGLATFFLQELEGNPSRNEQEAGGFEWDSSWCLNLGMGIRQMGQP